MKSPAPPFNEVYPEYVASNGSAVSSSDAWDAANDLWFEAVKPLVEALERLFAEEGAEMVHPAPDENIVRVDITDEVWQDLQDTLAPFTE